MIRRKPTPPLLIYFANDYDEQNAGEIPHGISLSYATQTGISVVESERTAGDKNKAAQFSYTDNSDNSFYRLAYAPISEKFVLSFDIKQNDVTKTKAISVATNAFDPSLTNYHQNYNGKGFQITFYEKSFRIKDSWYSFDFQNNVWHGVDILFDVANTSAEVYIDGNKYFETASFAGDEKIVNIGHAEMKGSGTNAVEMIKAIGTRLKALHIHDNDKLHDSHQIPFSMSIDFDEIVKALKAVEYKGYLTLEAKSYLGAYFNDNVFEGIKNLAVSARKLADMFEA